MSLSAARTVLTLVAGSLVAVTRTAEAVPIRCGALPPSTRERSRSELHRDPETDQPAGQYRGYAIQGGPEGVRLGGDRIRVERVEHPDLGPNLQPAPRGRQQRT